MKKNDISKLPDIVWKLIITHYSNPYRKTYGLVRYSVDRKYNRIIRSPEHQDWSLTSDSFSELMMRIAAEKPDAYCFGTDHFNNLAPQSVSLENIRMIKLDSFFTNNGN